MSHAHPNCSRQPDPCIFCNVTVENGFRIVHEDEELIAFHDRSPQAEVHLLITPRKHIVSSVKDLRPSHIPLLHRMTALALTLSSSPPKLGFHIPPFSSVSHLHMHVLVGRLTLLGRLKYRLTSHGGRKRFGWFVTPQQVVEILDKGGKVGLGRG